jgi:hypothetical protein
VAQLLLVENLVGSGRVARLTKFRLGAAVAGKRRIELAWETQRRYSTVNPERRDVAGTVMLP